MVPPAQGGERLGRRLTRRTAVARSSNGSRWSRSHWRAERPHHGKTHVSSRSRTSSAIRGGGSCWSTDQRSSAATWRTGWMVTRDRPAHPRTRSRVTGPKRFGGPGRARVARDDVGERGVEVETHLRVAAVDRVTASLLVRLGVWSVDQRRQVEARLGVGDHPERPGLADAEVVGVAERTESLGLRADDVVEARQVEGVADGAQLGRAGVVMGVRVDQHHVPREPRSRLPISVVLPVASGGPLGDEPVERRNAQRRHAPRDLAVDPARRFGRTGAACGWRPVSPSTPAPSWAASGPTAAGAGGAGRARRREGRSRRGRASERHRQRLGRERGDGGRARSAQGLGRSQHGRECRTRRRLACVERRVGDRPLVGDAQLVDLGLPEQGLDLHGLGQQRPVSEVRQVSDPGPREGVGALHGPTQPEPTDSGPGREAACGQGSGSISDRTVAPSPLDEVPLDRGRFPGAGQWASTCWLGRPGARVP